MNSMMTGSAKHAITLLYDRSSPTSSGSHIHLIPESLQKSSMAPMMATDVAHEGTTSIIHIRVAKAKMAMMRCCTTLSPSMPKAVEGRFHSMSVMTATMTASKVFFITLEG